MATMRRMPQNIDTLDAVTPFMEQSGATTVFSGNLEVDGKLQVNQPVTVNVGDSLTEGYHINRKTTSYDYDSVYGQSKIIITQKNKDGSIKKTREFLFPPKGGTIAADLCRHVIKGTTQGSSGAGDFFFAVIISSNSTKVNSLTALKTLLGNTFQYPVTGCESGNSIAYVYMDETGVYNEENTKFAYSDYPVTWTDTVTAV